MRTVKVFEEAWPLHTPFVIARGSRSEARVVVVELEEEGIKGTGECTPYPLQWVQRCAWFASEAAIPIVLLYGALSGLKLTAPCSGGLLRE